MTDTDLDDSGERPTERVDIGEHSTDPVDFAAVQASPEFRELRRRLRRFVFPMTALFLLWYLGYVLLGAYAHDFMSTKVFGEITVGLLLGLGQFVSTFVITGLYVKFADRQLDPRATALRGTLEGQRS